MNPALFTLALAITLPAPVVPENGFCVRNLSGETLFFTTDAGAHGRTSATLESGGTLCTGTPEAPSGGFVSVFVSEDAIEGCSRLVGAGDVVDLLAYHDFDRCLWSGPAE